MMIERYKCADCGDHFGSDDIIKLYSGGTAYKTQSVDYYCKECFLKK